MFFPEAANHANGSSCSSSSSSPAASSLGVGSGRRLGDVLRNRAISQQQQLSAQIKKDQQLIKDNPKDYAAYKDLAAAQAADGKLDDAITTLQQLKSVNPKDVEGLSQLASIYVRKADVARVAAQVAQAKAQTVVPQSTFAPAPSTAIGKAYSGLSAPIGSALEGQVNEQFQNAYSKMTAAYSQAVAAYQDVAKQSPSDASIQVALAQTAEQAGDAKTAIAAYRHFLKLAPDDSLAPAVKQRIKSLQQQPAVSTG
jgi:Flp pilus assembly protein TadD